jgi:protocatechuate 3,4-dioxygenase beta subunit
MGAWTRRAGAAIVIVSAAALLWWSAARRDSAPSLPAKPEAMPPVSAAPETASAPPPSREIVAGDPPPPPVPPPEPIAKPQAEHAIRGHVVDAQGAPVAEARVFWTTSFSPLDMVDEETRSAADGSFTLRCTLRDAGRDGSVELAADKAGYAVTSDVAATADQTDVVIRLARGGVVIGLVTDGSGLPVARAKVALDLSLYHIDHTDGDFPSEAERLAITGADGRFELRDVPLGLVHLRATADEHSVEAVKVTVPPVGEGTVTITLRRTGLLHARVIDRTTREPIADAQVSSHVNEKLRTDAQGRFSLKRYLTGEIPFEKRAVWAGVRKAGYARASVWIPIGSEEEFLIELERPAILTGTVHDPEGRPLAGAELSLTSSKNRDVKSGPELDTVEVKSGDDGTFRAELAPGTYDWVKLESPSCPSRRLDPFVARAGETTDWQLVPGEGPALRGVVTDGVSGAVIEGADVKLERGDGRGSYSWLASTRSQGDGRFLLRGLDREPFWIVITAPGHAPLLQVATAQPLEQAPELAFVLDRGSTMSGDVVDASGRPVAGALVVVEPVLSPPELAKLLFFGENTDGAGAFSIADLPAVAVRVTVWPPHARRQELAAIEKRVESPPFGRVHYQLGKTERR